MPTDFPDPKNNYLRAVDFQDRSIPLTYLKFEYKHNEDDAPNKKQPKRWQDKIKYCLPYTYPEYAINKDTLEQMLDSNGKPFRNSYWNPDYPHGYSILYHFKEGVLESGSKPLFEAFCRLKPKANEKIVIKRTGKQQETEWFVGRAADLKEGEVPTIQLDDSELQPDQDVPF